MKDEDKLVRIHFITNKIWNWLCDNPILTLMPPIEEIRKLSASDDCFGTWEKPCSNYPCDDKIECEKVTKERERKHKEGFD